MLFVQRRSDHQLTLDVADDASLSPEPLILIVNAVDAKDALTVAEEIADLRTSGELKTLIIGMGIVEL